MIIVVDEKEIYIPKELINKLSKSSLDEFQKVYMQFEPTIRLGIKGGLRTFLLPWIEKKTGMKIRPDKETDPLLYLLKLLSEIVEDLSDYATINFKTERIDRQAYSPASFNFTLKDKSESWRQLAFSWQKRKREDSILEDSSKSSD